jgi:hypothetical protein
VTKACRLDQASQKPHAIPCKALAQNAEDPLGIEEILECQHGIVSEADKGTSPLETWAHLELKPLLWSNNGCVVRECAGPQRAHKSSSACEPSSSLKAGGTSSGKKSTSTVFPPYISNWPHPANVPQSAEAPPNMSPPHCNQTSHALNAAGMALPVHDKDMAAEFLVTLDSAALRFTFQFFTDAGAGHAAMLHGSLDDVWPKIQLLNTPSRGTGVFVTADLKGRRSENIVCARAIWVDAWT